MGRPLVHSDLIFEVLLRLPPKSLFRFSCVCRSWSALVSLPVFRDRRPTALLSCASVQDFEDNVTLHFSTFDSDGYLKKQFVKQGLGSKPWVLSTCRDLLLFRDCANTFLCNYVTQELITLPNIADGTSYGGVGFGYVPSTKEFKVLAKVSFFRHCYTNFSYDYMVLTLGDDRWRDVGPPPFSVVGYGTAFVNGNIHVQVEGRGNKIASFNLEREEWRGLAGPSNCNSFHRSLEELNRYLCMVDHRTYYMNDYMDIWLLKNYDDTGSWVKEYSIRISTLKAEHPLVVMPLAIDHDGRLLVQVDMLSCKLYDPKSKSSREIHRFEELDDTRNIYVKCFSSLRQGVCS